MKITPKLRELLYPQMGRQKERIASLSQSLEDTSRFYNEQLAKVQLLRTELEYLYSILLQKGRCYYELHVLSERNPLLLVTKTNKNWIEISAYLVNRRKEVVSVYAQMKNETLIIEDMQIDWPCYSPPTGLLLFQEIMVAAESLKTQRVTGRLGKVKTMSLDEMASLYKEIGFDVTVFPAIQVLEVEKLIANKATAYY